MPKAVPQGGLTGATVGAPVLIIGSTLERFMCENVRQVDGVARLDMALRVHDALGAGASQSDIAAAVFWP